MSYQVLALKYRPLRFEDVIAQEHVTRTLARAVETGRVAHGYLFTGPRGTGKTTTARILAKALNCEKGPTPTPCNECSICKEITAGSSLDVLEIDAASNTGVDDVRTLRENIRYLPTSGKKRVFIIDEVHRLSGSAFDALLKTLEEPPDHAVFIFATTEPNKVPQTILSRTQRYDLRRVKTTDLAAHLEKLAKLEGIEIEQEALFLIARKGEGSVRDSMSLLDQMIALADGPITRELTATTLGIVDRQLFVDLMEIIAGGNSQPVFDMVQNLFDSGADITEFVVDFIDYIRNLLVQKSSNEPDKILEVSSAEKEALVRQVTYFTEADLLRMIQILSDLLRQLKNGYDERIFLEICLVRLARMESSISLQEVIERLNKLSSGQPQSPSPGGTRSLFSQTTSPRTTGGTRPQAPPPPPPPPSATRSEKPETRAEAGRPLNLPYVQTTWKKFLDQFRQKKPMLANMLAMGQIHEVHEDRIVIVFGNGNATNKQVVEKPEYLAIIEEALRDFYSLAVRIEFILDHKRMPQAEPPAAADDVLFDAEELLASDPELKKLVDQIDGEIIGRRKIDS